jgi:hypothetical protein
MTRSVELNPCDAVFLPRIRCHDGNPDHDCPIPGQQPGSGLHSLQRILEMLEGVMKHDHVPLPLACFQGSLEDSPSPWIFDTCLHIQVDPPERVGILPCSGPREKSPTHIPRRGFESSCGVWRVRHRLQESAAPPLPSALRWEKSNRELSPVAPAESQRTRSRGLPPTASPHSSGAWMR